ncbi:MAG: hypothetical protein ABSF15_14840, partial [Candidatus Sulfotelmatobacter sp.]
TDLGKHHFLLLAEVSQPEENTSQPFLTGFEMLVNQILFISNIPRQQRVLARAALGYARWAVPKSARRIGWRVATWGGWVAN